MYVLKTEGLVYIFNTLYVDIVKEVICWEGGWRIVNCNANEKNGLVFLLWEYGRAYMSFYSLETEDKKYYNISL